MINPVEYTVLIVDDVVANLNLLIDQLLAQGYQVRVAESGESALKRVQSGRPDIILMDVHLPGIDGFETCRRLKSDPALVDVPVIFLTVLADRDNKVEGFEAGGVDYIAKPIDAVEVLLRIRTHLTLGRLQQELAQANEELENRVAVRTQELRDEVTRRTHTEKEKGVLLDVVRRQSEQLQSLTNQVLADQSRHRTALSDDLLGQATQHLTEVDQRLLVLGETVVDGESQAHLQQITDKLAQVRHLIEQAGEALVAEAAEEADIQANPLLTLSEREREVLMLLVNDYAVNEIASMLQVTTSTVRTYQHRILQKLDVKDVPGLVRFAIKYNLTQA